MLYIESHRSLVRPLISLLGFCIFYISFCTMTNVEGEMIYIASDRQ